MKSPAKFYLSHMYAQTRYRATWDPTKQLCIGYVGKLDLGIFTVYSSLEKEGIRLSVGIDESGAAMDYTSHDQVSITAKLAGTAAIPGSILGPADAGFSVSFKSEKGIVFQTGNHKVHQLLNLAEVEQQILAKYQSGNWDKDWVVITELVEADTATIIISNSHDGILDLKASAATDAARLSLTDASIGLAVARERGSSLKYIAQNGLTPLYRVMGIRRPLWAAASVARKDMLPQVSASGLQTIEFDERELEGWK